MTETKAGFATRSVHAGAAPDPTTKARATPIYQTTSFTFDDVEHAQRLFGLQEFGNIYTRIGNPTCGVLENRIADLEGGTAALAVASGHAAQQLVFHTLMQPGDRFVAARNLYGGSINQFGHAFKKFGWHVDWADVNDLDQVKAAIGPQTKAIFCESLANPGGVITDLEPLAKLAQEHHLPLIVDNTMATPALLRPFEWGANIVVHSVTKFLGGHGNSIAGALVDGGTFDWSKDNKFPTLSTPNPSYDGMALHATFGGIAFAIACRVMGLRDLGPALAPFNAFMILTGIETLPLRMQRQSQTALAVARHLAAHPAVAWVSYPGLEGDKFHPLATKYLPHGHGAVFTFGVKGGYDAGVKLVGACELLSHLANIGDTRSLIIHPASTTHRQLTDAQKTAAGAGPDVVRLSIGLEDAADVIADLERGLS